MTGINLESKLLEVKSRNKRQPYFVPQTAPFQQGKNENSWKVNLLQSERIFHLEDIRHICVDYRLRFLDIAYFKGVFPKEAAGKIAALEKAHQTEITNLKIVAPAKLFRLKNADDPMLFAPLGDDYYYLAHKWGNDLHPLRKWLVWPFKNFENLLFTIFLGSILLTFMVPQGLFSKEQSIANTFVVFLFMFKWVAAVVLFYGFALGKNFNSAIWNSTYFNA